VGQFWRAPKHPRAFAPGRIEPRTGDWRHTQGTSPLVRADETASREPPPSFPLRRGHIARGPLAKRFNSKSSVCAKDCVATSLGLLSPVVHYLACPQTTGTALVFGASVYAVERLLIAMCRRFTKPSKKATAPAPTKSHRYNARTGFFAGRKKGIKW
jgi:hypothetical protein